MSTERTPFPSPDPWPRAYVRLGAALVVVGVAARLFRYFLAFPLWEDEAYVALNIRERGYAGLLRQLDHLQVAPILFLWGERAVGEALGYSEYALRLLPLLAGTGSLLLLWHLARRTLPPLAGVVAVGLFAVSRWPVSLGSQVKPYTFDSFFALALLVPAVHWVRSGRDRWLLALAVVVPVAVASSFAVVFVAGGVGLALLPGVWRRASRRSWALFVAYNALLVGAFAWFDVVIGRQQLGPPGSRLHDFMTDYWAHGFPPLGVGAFLEWLVVVHTGLLMAYPLGNSNGAGLLAFPLVVVGTVAAWRRGWRTLVLLCLAPFALNFVAAALHRYPYGGCCRLSQHLAPAVALLFGIGVEAVANRLARTPAERFRAALIWAGVFAALAAAGAVTYAVKPYREDIDRWSRDVARDLAGRVRPGDEIVLLSPPHQIPPHALWYLRGVGATAWPAGQPNRLPVTGGRLWCVSFGYGNALPSPDALTAPLADSGVRLSLFWQNQTGLSDDSGAPTWSVVVCGYEVRNAPDAR